MRLIKVCLAVFMLCHSPVYAEQDKNQQKIRVIINDWTSQHILSLVTGNIFTSIGYQVEYPFSSTNEQWGSLSHGIDHVQIEVWQGTMAEMFNRMISSGRLIDAGTHDAKTREDWWYPEYVETLCPGLPDWRALKKCAAMFSLSKSSDTGRYIAGPWEKPEAARIRALGLKFKVDRVDKAEDLWAYLKAAEQKHLPIVLFNWTPNWVEAVYKGKFVEFPEYHPDCETNPLWGVNPSFHYDCGNPKNGWLKKAAWKGMPKQWPCAYETLKNINFNNATISMLASWVDFDKLTYQAAAERWLKENKVIWQNWIPSECRLNIAS
jgi:glycine betaine/proline transport system substrate-binding protein